MPNEKQQAGDKSAGTKSKGITMASLELFIFSVNLQTLR